MSAVCALGARLSAVRSKGLFRLLFAFRDWPPSSVGLIKARTYARCIRIGTHTHLACGRTRFVEQSRRLAPRANSLRHWDLHLLNVVEDELHLLPRQVDGLNLIMLRGPLVYSGRGGEEESRQGEGSMYKEEEERQCEGGAAEKAEGPCVGPRSCVSTTM